MTWKEFKEEVDRQIEEKGIPEDEYLWVIDISFPEKDWISVFVQEGSGIMISE